MPTLDAWNATVQRQLTNTTSLEVAYIGNKGTNGFAGDGNAVFECGHDLERAVVEVVDDVPALDVAAIPPFDLDPSGLSLIEQRFHDRHCRAYVEIQRHRGREPPKGKCFLAEIASAA